MPPVPFSKICGSCSAAAISCAFCEQSFHASDVDIDVASLKAVSSSIGLQWFCEGCWPDVQTLMASAKKRPSEQAPSPKKARLAVSTVPGPERSLPAEIWEPIFLGMDPPQLLRIRQTCRYWRDIVNGSHTLLDKFKVHFPAGIQMDQNYQPESLRPATRATWRSGAQTKLVCVDSWWPTFGPKLTHLNMEFTEVSFATLLDMLRCTPNLQNFSSGSITHGSVAAADVAFRLDMVERLHVRKTPGSVVEILAQICPRVKSLRVDHLNGSRAEDKKIFHSISSLQRSLEEIVLVGLGSYIVHDLRKLNHLKLRKIHLHKAIDVYELLEFCKLQPDLEIFNVLVYGSNEELVEIGQSCPKLKKIDASISQNDGAAPTFLNTMSKLERLRLSAMKDTALDTDEEDFSDPDVDLDVLVKFDGVKNEHLVELDLHCMRPDTTSLQSYVKQSPKLTNLHLGRCPFAKFADLVAVLQAVQSLEHVKLSGIKIERNDPFKSSTHKCMNSLKRLEISQCHVTLAEINYLLSLCPMLEELTLKNQVNIVLNHKLGSLKKLDLRLSICNPRSIFSIVFYCRSLKELLVSADTLSADCREVLEKQFGANLSLIVC